jgi:hypothetical protein
MSEQLGNELDQSLDRFLKKFLCIVFGFFFAGLLLFGATQGVAKLKERNQKREARLGELEKVARKFHGDMKVVIEGLDSTMKRCEKNEVAVQHLLRKQGQTPKQ